MKHLRTLAFILGAVVSYSPLVDGQAPKIDPRAVRSADQPAVAKESAVSRTVATKRQINLDQAVVSNSINDLVQLHKGPDQPNKPCGSCHSVSPTGNGGAATAAVTPNPAVVSQTLLDAIVNLCPSIQTRLAATEAGKTLWSLVELRAEIVKELTKPEARGECARE
jgi:hypothetical protein